MIAHLHTQGARNEEDYFVVSVSSFWIGLTFGLRQYDRRNSGSEYR